MNTSLRTLIIVFALLFLIDKVYAAPVPISIKSSKLKFVATGNPGFLKVKGEVPDSTVLTNLKLEDGQVRGTLEIDLNLFDTGIGLRNEHMKEKYLETQKYPKALLTITETAPTLETLASLKTVKNLTFKGQLSLHGKTQPITGTCELSDGGRIVDTKFKFNLSDFGVEIPTHFGVTVSEKVDVESQLEVAQ